jgi:hypothetical protein
MIIIVKDKQNNSLNLRLGKTKKNVEHQQSSLNFKGQHSSKLGESKEET